MSDWLTALDDGLVERLTHCTVCGRQPPVLWGICGTAGMAIAYVLCQRCKESGGMPAVERLFAQRYEAGSGGQGPRATMAHDHNL